MADDHATRDSDHFARPSGKDFRRLHNRGGIGDMRPALLYLFLKNMRGIGSSVGDPSSSFRLPHPMRWAPTSMPSAPPSSWAVKNQEI